MTHSSTKNWKIENWRKCHSKQRLFKKWQFSSFFSAAERHSDHGLAVFARTCIRPNRSCLVQFCHVIVYPLPQKANSNVPKTFKLSLMCASHFEQSQPRPRKPRRTSDSSKPCTARVSQAAVGFGLAVATKHSRQQHRHVLVPYTLAAKNKSVRPNLALEGEVNSGTYIGARPVSLRQYTSSFVQGVGMINTRARMRHPCPRFKLEYVSLHYCIVACCSLFFYG